jgi:hypothetical protein
VAVAPAAASPAPEAKLEAEASETRAGRVTDCSQISSDNSSRLLSLSPTKGQCDQGQHRAAADQMMLLCASPSQEVRAAAAAALREVVLLQIHQCPVPDFPWHSSLLHKACASCQVF